jgi:hypothetical protein
MVHLSANPFGSVDGCFPQKALDCFESKLSNSLRCCTRLLASRALSAAAFRPCYSRFVLFVKKYFSDCATCQLKGERSGCTSLCSRTVCQKGQVSAAGEILISMNLGDRHSMADYFLRQKHEERARERVGLFRGKNRVAQQNWSAPGSAFPTSVAMGEHVEMKDSKKECWQEPFFVTGVTGLQHTEVGEQLHGARADCPYLTTLATRKNFPL